MPDQHIKEFDKWNTTKKSAESSERKVFGYPREVWWCALGVNIGAEIDGKNDNFERPVIVMRVYNKETMLVLPTTGRAKADKFHVALEVETVDSKTNEKFRKTVYVKLTQSRVISNKRLIRKIGDRYGLFQENPESVSAIRLNESTPRISAGRLGGRSPNS